MLKRMILAAALLAVACPLAQAAGGKTKATAKSHGVKAKASVPTRRTRRVRVNVNSRSVMPPAKAGQFRWDFWQRATPVAPITNVPPARP